MLAKTKVACVGDSITYGMSIPDRDHKSYPAVLGELLGRRYEVRNFGVSATTLLKAGDHPYWETPDFQNATAFTPDIVVIKLGSNDAKKKNFDGREEQFRPDYEAMIDHFSKVRGKPQLFLCLPAPSFRDSFGIRESVLKTERQIIRDIATERKLPVIDLYTRFADHPEWFPDGIHPNAEGAAEIAKTVAESLQKADEKKNSEDKKEPEEAMTPAASEPALNE
jgi:acyl-CoA thioesterase-1